MAWPSELGADLQFLDGFVDQTMDPSLSMLDETANIGTNTFLPTPPGLDDTTSIGANPFLPISEALDNATPFWP